jgi:ASC-1-like (ASCH) protein
MFEQTSLAVIDCDTVWFEEILQHRKLIEGRKATAKWKAIEKNEIVIIREKPTTNNNTAARAFYALVKDVRCYEKGPKALRRFLEAETLAKVLPGVECLAEAEDIYFDFPAWSRRTVDATGMLAFELEVLFK